VLQRGVGRGVPFSDFPASGAAPSAAGWKVGEEKTVEGVPALKHGANENAEKEFSALICVVYSRYFTSCL